eukprot:CAMPEP_0206386974 /NCGR_PEP_ID=MMETSP0294-20121207/16297_1 /ASSEMBLY_ACC=CAM_ASM_000327 /TAXON_ID=39354 /ORGANISM="Heterosigma akashiwo, Strain CCMP2393" /LENGTH=300 /DNA_ID=CAMNT_0053838193 /DNA_START=203 /DNA_END=1102 /DNA_ORIENTATION=-
MADDDVNYNYEEESVVDGDTLMERYRRRMRRWVPMLILGSIGPAVFANIIVFVGSILVTLSKVYPDEYVCSAQPLDQFLEGAIAISLIFLLCFMWIFIGLPVSINIKGRKWTVLRPFTNIIFLGAAFLLIWVFSLAWWLYGSYMVGAGAWSCSNNTPALYSFSLFVVVFYWVGLGLGLVHLVVNIFSKQIGEGLKVGKRLVNPALADDDFLLAKFAEYDEGGTEQVARQHLGPLCKDCGRPLSTDELQEARELLDPDQTGFIGADAFLSWFRTGRVEEGEEKDDSEEEEEEDDGGRRKKR